MTFQGASDGFFDADDDDEVGALMLDYYTQTTFDAKEKLLDDICSCDLILEEDDGQLQFEAILERLEHAGEGINELKETQKKRIEELNLKSVGLSEKFTSTVNGHIESHRGIMKNFNILESKMSNVCTVARTIGDRLNAIEMQYQRALFAREILQYFESFHSAATKEIKGTDAHIFRDISLYESAAFISELEYITEGLGMKGCDETCRMIKERSENILRQLLETFDKANSERDYDKMHKCADVVVHFFKHRQGGEHLFRRYVYYCLEPLAATRKLSAAYKLADMEANLTLLFRQIRNVVRNQHQVVKQVFPESADDVMAMLVERLFNDDVCGLQPVLRFFLYPEHRNGQLPIHEFLKVLATAHNQTVKLAEELSQSLKLQETRNVEETGISAYEPVLKHFSESEGPYAKLLLRRRTTMAKNSSHENKPAFAAMKIKFDSRFLRTQTHSVFEQYTGDYLEKERHLFKHRVFNILIRVQPKRLVLYHGDYFQEFEDEIPDVKLNEETEVKAEEVGIDMKVKCKLLAAINPTDPALVMLRSGILENCDMRSVIVKTLALTESQDLGYLPRQILSWSYEAFERCLELLVKERPSEGGKTLSFTEANHECVSSVSLLFQDLCNFLFTCTLMPTINILLLQLPYVSKLKESDNTGTIEAIDEVTEAIQNGRSCPKVVGLDDVGPEVSEFPRFLPLLAVNNSGIKAMATRCSRRSKESEHVIFDDIQLFLTALPVVETSVEMAAKHWHDEVFQVIQEFPTEANSCQEYMEQNLDNLEDRISFGLRRIIQYTNAQMQALVIAFQNKQDYKPSQRGFDDSSFDKPTVMAAALSSFIQQILEIFSNCPNSKLQERMVLNVGLYARDVFLGSWRRTKISQQGALKLLRDIEVLSTTFLPYCSTAKLAMVTSSWRLLKELAQLFVVKPASLSDIVADEKSSLFGISNQLLYDCICRRSDYKSSLINGRSDWAKALFAKKEYEEKSL